MVTPNRTFVARVYQGAPLDLYAIRGPSGGPTSLGADLDTVFKDTVTGHSTLDVHRVRAPALHGDVPRHVASTEPWIGGALAVFSIWLYAIAFRGAPVLIVYAVIAAAITAWSYVQPARFQIMLAGRAAAFVLLALGVQVYTHLDPADAPFASRFFYLFVVPTVLYAYLLRPKFAVSLLVVSCLAFLMPIAISMPSTLMGEIGVRGSFMIIFSVAVIRIAIVLRRTDDLLEARRVDANTGMLNEYGILDHGAELWANCRETNDPCTLVFIDIPDLRNLRSLYDSQTARVGFDTVHNMIADLEGPRVLIARLRTSRFALLVPGYTESRTTELLRERFGFPSKIEIDDHDIEMIFPVEFHAVDNEGSTLPFTEIFSVEQDRLERNLHKPQPVPKKFGPVAVTPATLAADAAAAALAARERIKMQADEDWREDQSPPTVPVGDH